MISAMLLHYKKRLSSFRWAYYLSNQQQERLARMVAHHSEAQYEARLRGLASELEVFPRESATLVDALTYCDITTNPFGRHISFQECVNDIFSGYGETDIVAQAIKQAMPALSQDVNIIRRGDINLPFSHER